MAEFVDYEGKLAISFGVSVLKDRPVRQETLSVSNIPVSEWESLLGQAVEFTGNYGRCFNPRSGRFLEVETTGWRSVTRETEITKPRDGREYTWSWGGYWGWQREDFSRCEICRKYHDPKFPYCESCGRCHKTDKKTVYHQICDRCHRPGKCKEEVLEECPR